MENVAARQSAPDEAIALGNYSRAVVSPKGKSLGKAGNGDRKDIWSAVATARCTSGWASATAHNRAQVLYYIAITLASHTDADALWGFGTRHLPAMVERQFSGSRKRTFVEYGSMIDRLDQPAAEGAFFPRYAVDVKNIWNLHDKSDEAVEHVGLEEPEGSEAKIAGAAPGPAVSKTRHWETGAVWINRFTRGHTTCSRISIRC